MVTEEKKDYLSDVLDFKSSKSNHLKFTGERIIPGKAELLHLYQEHVIRYMFASQIAKSKVVLDVGCGTGYGSNIMKKKGAKKVIGIDISKNAINFCLENYHDDLEFEIRDCTNSGFADSTFDLIVAFEVIEHLKNPEAFIAEADRILKPNGLLIVSTPNKLTYQEGNEFHYKEFTESEFKEAIGKNFAFISMFYQSYPSSLAIYQSGQSRAVAEVNIEDQSVQVDQQDALYFVAVCSHEKIEKLSSKLFLFKDKTLILENYPYLPKLQKEFEERTQWALKLDAQIKEKDEHIKSLQKEFEERTQWALKLDAQIKEETEKSYRLKDELSTKTSQITDLQNTLSTKTSQITDLQNTLSTKTSQITDLQNTLSTKASQITDLQNTLSTKASQITDLQNTLSVKDIKIMDLENTINIKNAQLETLDSNLLNKSIELEEIQKSLIFGIGFKIARTLDNFCPASSKRREILRLTRVSLAILKNGGLSTFYSAFKQKLRIEFASRKIKSPVKKEIPKFYLDTKDISSVEQSQTIIFNEGNTSEDVQLRKDLEIGAANILNLPRFPLISIIISTYDQLDFLKKNLKSIETKTTYKNYEIIIVTNNLNEKSEMRKFLATIKHKVILFEGEYSFAGINNFAAKKTSGEFLLFLNDDVEIICPNWLESMLKLALDQRVGAVGGKLLFPDGKLQEAGCIVWKNGNAWNYGRNSDPTKPDFNYVREVDYCSGSCLMVKRSVFEKIGGFDLRFKPAYSEDNDLCHTIRQMGYSVLYQPLAEVIHYEGRTQGTDVTSGIKHYQIDNEKRLNEKWKNVFEKRNPDSQENIYLERNRKDGINILYIDHYVPEYDRDAGSLTTYYIACTLTALGNNVTFWPENLNKKEPYVQELQQKGVEVLYGPNNFESFIKERGWTFHVCFMARPHISIRFIDLVKKYAPKCKIVYDTHDLHFVREFRDAVMTNDQTKHEKAKQTKEDEFHIISKSDIVIVRSMKEAKLLLKEIPSTTIAVIPPLQLTKNSTSGYQNRKDLLFIGGFQHLPNRNAVEFLVNEIMPKIKKRLPDVKLYIIGSNPPQNIIDLCSNKKGIDFLGYVENVDPYLENCRVMVAPLTYGAGVKGKITQSMAYGLPVVTTSIGAEGISQMDGKVLLIGENSTDFANKVESVYNDQKLWTRLSNAGIDFANRYYSPEITKKTLNQILVRCLMS